jgi:hypothetical protein
MVLYSNGLLAFGYLLYHDEQKVNWKNYVAPLVHAYNATRHESTNYSPHFFKFGWHPRLGIDAFLVVMVMSG